MTQGRKVYMRLMRSTIENITKHTLILENDICTKHIEITEAQFNDTMNAFCMKRLPSDKREVVAKQEIFTDTSQ